MIGRMARDSGSAGRRPSWCPRRDESLQSAAAALSPETSLLDRVSGAEIELRPGQCPASLTPPSGHRRPGRRRPNCACITPINNAPLIVAAGDKGRAAACKSRDSAVVADDTDTNPNPMEPLTWPSFVDADMLIRGPSAVATTARGSGGRRRRPSPRGEEESLDPHGALRQVVEALLRVFFVYMFPQMSSWSS